MSIICKTIGLKEFSKYKSIRLASCYELPKTKFPYDLFTEFIQLCESGSRPKGGINPEDYGQAVSLGGEQIGKDGTVVTESLPYVSYDFFDISTKGRVMDQDILLCKDGALTGKVCMVSMSEMPTEKIMVNEHVYVVRANKKIKQELLYYLMRTPLFLEQIKDLAYRKKAQPGLSSEHIRALKIPEIPLPLQDTVLNRISLLTYKINLLRNEEHDIQATIDSVFQREFNFDYDTFEELKTHKTYTLRQSLFSNNPDLRFSAKYHRPAGDFVMEQLTGITDKKIKHFLAEPIVLGASISPSDFDENGEAYYVSMATIKTLEVELDETQLVSPTYYESHKAKSLQKGDIIIARSGVAIGKTAIVKDDFDGIFADFTMRIRFDNTRYNPTFAYYYLRSKYFQYLIEVYKKGLQNQNIFPIVMQEFPIPDILLSEQQRILDEIQAEISKQDEIKNQIAELRSQIDDIIMETISV